MKTLKLWLIPAAFYAVTCILNLYGCLTDGPIEKYVKPALLPLLCVTTVAYLFSAYLGHRKAPLKKLKNGDNASSGEPSGAENSCDYSDAGRLVGLLVAGQLFGYAGDTMLLGKGFAFFAGGIGLFLIGHIFYISLFGGISWKGIKPVQWAIAVVCMLAATAGLILCIGVNGTMLVPMGVYGCTLMVLIFSGLSGVIRSKSVSVGGHATWWIIFCGAVLFAYSDSLIAVRNFGTLSPFMSGFGVMFTYLIAQTLLAIGGIRLILKK